jgi:type I restriction enzyme S subunit
MKEGWKLKTLNELFDVKSSKRVHKADWKDKGVPFYRAREVVKLAQNGNVDNTLFISEELYNEFTKEKGAPKVGDIIISAVGTLGQCYLVKSGDKFYFKDASVLWFENISNVNTRYIEYAFKADLVMKQVMHKSMGATVGTLTISRAKIIEIPIPLLPEQQQIVALLDQAFEAIDQAKANIEKNIENAKELFQSKLNNIFSQKGEGWEEKSLGKACEISMGQSPKGTSYNSEGIGTPLINGPVEFGPKPFSKTVMTKWTTEPTKLCKEGDLILCVRGSTTGRINIAGFNACIGRGVASIRYSKNQEWINFFIRCNQKNIYDLGTGSTFPNVSGKIISSMKFSEPVSSEIQNNLVEVMKKLELDINSILKNYLKKLSDLEELKKSILQKAFAGELTNKVVEV